MKINIMELDMQPNEYVDWEEPIKTYIGLKYRPTKTDEGYIFSFPAQKEGKQERSITLLVDRSGIITFQGGNYPKNHNEWYIKQTVERVNELYEDLVKSGLLYVTFEESK